MKRVAWMTLVYALFAALAVAAPLSASEEQAVVAEPLGPVSEQPAEPPAQAAEPPARGRAPRSRAARHVTAA